jgi:thymidine phosphorylase
VIVQLQAVEMLRLAEPGLAEQAAVSRVEAALDSGAALARLARLVEAQGGDTGVIDSPERLVTAPERLDVVAAGAGTVLAVAPKMLGQGVVALGGGRRNMDQKPDLSVGFQMHVQPGDEVSAGDLLATVHARDAEGANTGEHVVRRAVTVGDVEQAPELRQLVSHRVDERGVVPL